MRIPQEKILGGEIVFALSNSCEIVELVSKFWRAVERFTPHKKGVNFVVMGRNCLSVRRIDVLNSISEGDMASEFPHLPVH